MPADPTDPAGLRRTYGLGGLDEAALAPDWLGQFRRWFAEAVAAGPALGLAEPNAMVVATATPDGRPGARTVLLKGYDARGLVFYTNLGSRKGRELAANPRVCAVFSWVAMERQVVVDGTVTPVGADETAAYFASRPYGSRLGAWASPQSQVVGGRDELLRRRDEAAARFPEDAPVPVPPGWGGLRVVPSAVEFWQGRPDRLHDRLRYRRADDGDGAGAWVVERLAP